MAMRLVTVLAARFPDHDRKAAPNRTIIEAHGGRLWATANDGYGTTLQFTLPTESVSVS
jgi:hypothetical protein